MFFYGFKIKLNIGFTWNDNFSNMIITQHLLQMLLIKLQFVVGIYLSKRGVKLRRDRSNARYTYTQTKQVVEVR